MSKLDVPYSTEVVPELGPVLQLKFKMSMKLDPRMSLYIVDEARFSVNASDGALAIADVGWIDRGEYECILLSGDGDGGGSEEELVR